MVKLLSCLLALQLLAGCAGLAVDWELNASATYTSTTRPKP